MKTIEDKIKEIVSAYKADFTRINDEERYKWQAIGHYKAHWNIDAKDFGAMFSEAFKLADKLLAANRYYPYKIVMDYIKIEPETVRKLFRILYNESIPLSQRYVDFRAGFDKFVNPIELNHYQDLHAISVYLSFEYPETYYIYQYKIYKAFREKTGFVEEKTKSKSEVWKLENYHCMCDLVLSIVLQDEELITMSKNRLDNSCYKDEAYHLLSMDIIYFASRLSKNQTEAEDEISYWPSLAEYNPNITVNNWTDILKDRTITSDENLSMLKMILEQGGESTCANLTQIYGNTYNYYNKLGSSFAEKVKKKYNCPDCMHNGVIRYYPVPSDRNTKDYTLALMWSRVFLMGKSFTSFSGSETAFALLFPMETLFESYIAAQLRRVLDISKYCVSAQDRTYHLFDEPNKKFLIKPDLVIRDKIGGVVYIMDTKWKVLSDEKPNYGISQADMYQMYAYQKKYSAVNVTLIFPLTEKISADKIIEFHSQDGVTVKVKFVDLFDIRKSLENMVSDFGV